MEREDDEDCREIVDDYFGLEKPEEILEHASWIHQYGDMSDEVYDLVRLALDPEAEALSDEQVYKLYEDFVKPLRKKCVICGTWVQIGVFALYLDTDYCRHHNDSYDKDLPQPVKEARPRAGFGGEKGASNRACTGAI
jgi:hypothetical protein